MAAALPSDNNQEIMREQQEVIDETLNTIYPAYLNKTKTRSGGRRVKANIAIHNPTLNEISKALDRLSIAYIAHNTKIYSREINKNPSAFGYIKYKKNSVTVSKTNLLNKLCETINEMRVSDQKNQQSVSGNRNAQSGGKNGNNTTERPRRRHR